MYEITTLLGNADNNNIMFIRDALIINNLADNDKPYLCWCYGKQSVSDNKSIFKLRTFFVLKLNQLKLKYYKWIQTSLL